MQWYEMQMSLNVVVLYMKNMTFNYMQLKYYTQVLEPKT